MKPRKITSSAELAALVRDVGMIPVFSNPIRGYSVQDCTPAAYWFTDIDGPWEWRMELAETGEFAYGKLLDGRAALMTLDWYSELANWRRRGYDFDALYEEGLASVRLKNLVDALEKNGAMLSHTLKAASGLEKGFDAAITKLQMQTYAAVKCFEYRMDARGKRYGWGVARYDLSERIYGTDTVTCRYDVPPEESFERLLEHMRTVCPDAEEKQLIKLLK